MDAIYVIRIDSNNSSYVSTKEKAVELIEKLAKKRGSTYETDTNKVLYEYSKVKDSIEVHVQESGLLYGNYASVLKNVIDFQKINPDPPFVAVSS